MADDLAGELAAGRAVSPSDALSKPRLEPEALTVLRGLARALGHEPDAVVDSFLKGGPLADLVRAVIGAEAQRRRRRGRPSKRSESWATFVSVVMLRRQGLTLEQAVGQVAVETDTPEATIRARYDRARAAGALPESVPVSPIVAAYADPRSEA